MLWIGITGALASGKSTVLGFLKDDYDYPTLSADAVVDELLKEKVTKAEIIQTLGPSVCTTYGDLDRKLVADMVFQNPEKLKKLELILHPKVHKKSSQWRSEMERLGHSLAFYEIPLLFESNRMKEFDFILGVFSPTDQRQKRYKERSGRDDFVHREKNQIPMEQKRVMSDFSIENNSSINFLKQQLKDVIDQLKAK